MYLIVGLGNPGKEYENTRHNVGFMAIDYLANKYLVDMGRERFKGNFGEYILDGEKIILLKPLTYMNLSGESITEVMNFYKIPIENLIVLYDDMAIDVGKIRLRASGSDGGHNGMKSIISCTGTKDFKRVRIGIGKARGSIVDYVLGRFSKEEGEIIEKSVEAAANSSISIIKEGIQNAMNKFNTFDESLEKK